MECMHHPGGRFDPVQCSACCPVCGAYGGAKPGDPVAPHQPQGSREMCPGSGQPAV